MKYMLIDHKGPKEITDFEKEIGVELMVKEKPKKQGLKPFYVQFESTEVKGPVGFLKGVFGGGNTIDEALNDYAKKISEQKIVTNVQKKRHSSIFFCPKLVHTKLLNK